MEAEGAAAASAEAESRAEVPSVPPSAFHVPAESLGGVTPVGRLTF